MAESKPSPTGKKPPAKPAKPEKTPTPTGDRAGGNLWESDPGAVRKFIEQRSDYEQLCGEVAYILTKRLELKKIKVVAVTSRAKTLASFLEKIERKGYPDPFAEVEDFAGTRVVCYYPDDLPKIEALIRSEFEVVKWESKREKMAVDQFGYMADHAIVKLGKTSAGARYDDLKSLVCEIQVRTILQDAWAVFSHHLLYKHEDEIPAQLKRHINTLAGVLENADRSFQSIRDEQTKYILNVANSITTNSITEVETNLDSLREYMKNKFPGADEDAKGLRIVYEAVNLQRKYPTLNAIDSLFQRTEQARAKVFSKLADRVKREPAADLLVALWLVDDDNAADIGNMTLRDFVIPVVQYQKLVTTKK